MQNGAFMKAVVVVVIFASIISIEAHSRERPSDIQPKRSLTVQLREVSGEPTTSLATFE